MIPLMDEKLARYRELETQLGDPDIAGNHAKFAVVAKEHGALAKMVKPYQDYLHLYEQIAQTEAMIAAESDAEMKAMAAEELTGLKPLFEALKNKIEDVLLIDPNEIFDSLIIEIRAGTGGDEAALFAGTLYEMYQKYARIKHYQIEEIDFSPGEAGGFKEMSFSIRGEGIYQDFKYESGGHRVQRVPKTETQGRIHTSLATVAVLPEPDEVQVVIANEDIEWERMRAGGAGGQKVNKTESAVRIWYRKGTPDEMEVKCQDERSQSKNYDRAMRVLRSRLFERQKERLHKERADNRKTQIGSGDRSARIRTYNFAENRCTDHRIGFTVYKMDVVLAGELQLMIDPMKEAEKKEKLAAVGSSST
ncbi:peptide chain release factor 1 [soil metagenome]